MVRMEAALDTYEAFKARAQAKNSEEFSRQHPQIVEYCWAVEQLREQGEWPSE